MPQFGYSRGYIYGYGYGYGYIQTMREKKGCQTDTAPPGIHHTTSADSCDAQDPDPMAEGNGLGTTSEIDEDGGLNNEYRNKPERHERPTTSKKPKTTRPPSNPERHQSMTPQSAAASQLVAARAKVVD